ncbi:MAG TPA: DUF5979 domain-containing protein [Candidatus Limnocylindrales bacterium]
MFQGTSSRAPRWRLVVIAGAAGFTAGFTATVTSGTAAWGQPFLPPELASAPSDSRAEYHSGNVTTCAQTENVPDDDVQIGAQAAATAQDIFISGTTSDGKYVNVTITPAGVAAGVVIDAVVVKGGDGYNVYRDPYVPPTLPSPQNYISPLTNGGNIPDLSHWFVCYHAGTVPGGGVNHALLGKVVIPPPGQPVQPLPSQFTVTVTCTGLAPFDVTFGAGGGVAIAGKEQLDNIPAGAVCTVQEQGTAGFPSGSQVRYIPATANTTGVVIGTTPVLIAVVNDFSGVAVKDGVLHVRKVVQAENGGALPASYTWGIACEDVEGQPTGQTGGGPLPQLVTVPGTGGEVLVDDIASGSQCAVAEDTTLLAGNWNVTYSVNGAEPVTRFPVFPVYGDTTVELVITNTLVPDAPAPVLPATGLPFWKLILLACGLIGAGAALTRFKLRTLS